MLAKEIEKSGGEIPLHFLSLNGPDDRASWRSVVDATTSPPPRLPLPRQERIWSPNRSDGNYFCNRSRCAWSPRDRSREDAADPSKILTDDIIDNKWGPPRGFGEQGNKTIYFRGTREQRLKVKGTGTKAILGNRKLKNQDFDFGEQGKNADFFQRNKGTGMLHKASVTARFAMQRYVTKKRFLWCFVTVFGADWT